MAVAFDGTGSAYYTASLDWPSLTNDTALETYAVWVRVDGYDSAVDNQILGYDSTFSYARHHWYITPAGAWRGYERERQYGDEVMFDFGDHGADSVWRLCLHRIDGTYIDTIYCDINGSPVITTSRAYSGTREYRVTSLVQLGRAANTTNQFTGALADMWRVESVLTDAHIEQIAAGTSIDEIATPANWWKLADPSDTTDYGTQGNDLVVTGSPSAATGPSFGSSGVGVSITLGAGQAGALSRQAVSSSGTAAGLASASTIASRGMVQAHAGASLPVGHGASTALGREAGARSGASAAIQTTPVAATTRDAGASAGASSMAGVSQITATPLQIAARTGRRLSLQTAHVDVDGQTVNLSTGNSISLSVVIEAGQADVIRQQASARAGRRMSIDAGQAAAARRAVYRSAGYVGRLQHGDTSITARIVEHRSGLSIITESGTVTVTGVEMSFRTGPSYLYVTVGSISITPAVAAALDITPAVDASFSIKPQ